MIDLHPHDLLVPAIVTGVLALLAAFLKFREYRRIRDFGLFGLIAVLARLGLAALYIVAEPQAAEITDRSALIRFCLTFLLLAEVTRFGIRRARQ